MTATLYRAVAYRLHRMDAAACDDWPEMTVFFEAADRDSAPAKLLRLLALAWSCEPADVEFYNLISGEELLAEWGRKDMGDAQLLISGWHHGPLFCRPDRTLMLVAPRTLARLRAARRATVPWHRQQRAKADQAAGVDRNGIADRQRALIERLEAAQSEMGAFC